jgi:hypothetical protein
MAQTHERNQSMTLTNDDRRTVDLFKTALSLIKTGPDGFPLPGQGLELDILAGKLLEVEETFLQPVAAGSIRFDDLDPEVRSLLSLTHATERLIDAEDRGDRDPSIPEKWFRARGELVEPQ